MRLAADGADIALLDINSDGIEETAQKIRAIGRKRANNAVLDFRGLLRWWVSFAAEVGT